jgi:hypothetical protein
MNKWILGLASILLWLGGCVAYVHSPPGRSFPLETAKTLYKRETGIQVEGGGGTEGFVGLPGFNVRVRHGLLDQLDLSGTFSYQRIRFEDLTMASSDRNVFIGRLGLKYAIIDYVALTAGLAAGGWAGGSFLSPDLAMIFAWENPYCVPFVDVGGYTSHPIHTQDVVIIDPDPSSIFGDEGLVASPVFTYGWTVGFGLRIPVMHRTRERQTAPAVLLGVRFRGVYFDPTYNDDGRNELTYLYGSVGFEYVITPRRNR